MARTSSVARSTSLPPSSAEKIAGSTSATLVLVIATGARTSRRAITAVWADRNRPRGVCDPEVAGPVERAGHADDGRMAGARELQVEDRLILLARQRQPELYDTGARPEAYVRLVREADGPRPERGRPERIGGEDARDRQLRARRSERSLDMDAPSKVWGAPRRERDATVA
jgi:hypothetical protein